MFKIHLYEWRVTSKEFYYKILITNSEFWWNIYLQITKIPLTGIKAVFLLPGVYII